MNNPQGNVYSFRTYPARNQFVLFTVVAASLLTAYQITRLGELANADTFTLLAVIATILNGLVVARMYLRNPQPRIKPLLTCTGYGLVLFGLFLLYKTHQALAPADALVFGTVLIAVGKVVFAHARNKALQALAAEAMAAYKRSQNADRHDNL